MGIHDSSVLATDKAREDVLMTVVGRRGHGAAHFPAICGENEGCRPLPRRCGDRDASPCPTRKTCRSLETCVRSYLRKVAAYAGSRLHIPWMQSTWFKQRLTRRAGVSPLARFLLSAVFDDGQSRPSASSPMTVNESRCETVATLLS